MEGSWPDAGAHERRRLGALLGAWDREADPGQPVTIVDGLVAVGAPDELEFAAKAGRQTWVLVHMPVPENAGSQALRREARALRAATGVICTSTSAANELSRRGLPQARVALPGVDPAPPAPGSTPPHLAVVAALLPNKDQLLAVEALARIQDLDWTASFVGSDRADPDYAREVQAAVIAERAAGAVAADRRAHRRTVGKAMGPDGPDLTGVPDGSVRDGRHRVLGPRHPRSGPGGHRGGGGAHPRRTGNVRRRTKTSRGSGSPARWGTGESGPAGRGPEALARGRRRPGKLAQQRQGSPGRSCLTGAARRTACWPCSSARD